MLQHGSNYYIAHPKTASIATAEALGRTEWVTLGGHHGIYPFPVGSKVISVVRDPLDWLVSWYHYLGKKESFPDFITTFRTPYQIDGMAFFGVFCSTHVIFYDNLQTGWDAVLDDIRRPRITLEHQNVSLDRRSVTDYYDNETFELFLKHWGDLYSWYQNIHSMKGSEPFLRRRV